MSAASSAREEIVTLPELADFPDRGNMVPGLGLLALRRVLGSGVISGHATHADGALAAPPRLAANTIQGRRAADLH